MDNRYDDCRYCGGQVEERLLPREIWWRGRLSLFENVPMGVCGQCGEKYLRPGVAKMLDAALERNTAPTKFIEVPVFICE